MNSESRYSRHSGCIGEIEPRWTTLKGDRFECRIALRKVSRATLSMKVTKKPRPEEGLEPELGSRGRELATHFAVSEFWRGDDHWNSVHTASRLSFLRRRTGKLCLPVQNADIVAIAQEQE